uniref:Uncharacterized protein n=1 Tax=Spongospora subterranea TaxID=70186 RepID=A0A0H5QRQ5_9EUKA|eukprot:CRZ04700.1 hypothetical protein [Spongospora subterranea]
MNPNTLSMLCFGAICIVNAVIGYLSYEESRISSYFNLGNVLICALMIAGIAMRSCIRICPGQEIKHEAFSPDITIDLASRNALGPTGEQVFGTKAVFLNC